jgi:peptidoglycan glycosyltransferase
VNAEIRRVAFVALVLLSALVVGTTYWQAWAAGDLAARQDNAIKRVAEFKIKRGLVYASDGTVLAANRRRKVNGETYYFRRYPERLLAANVVGYSTQGRARAGIERSLNDYLTGSNANLRTVVKTTVDELLGKTVVGNSVVLTINPEIQRAAQRPRTLRGGRGHRARDGRMLAWRHRPPTTRTSSRPTTSASRSASRVAGPPPPSSTARRPVSTRRARRSRSSPLRRRWIPAMSRRRRRSSTPASAPSTASRSRTTTSRPFGRLSFTQAMQYSVNSVFCNVGKDIGGVEIVDFMPRFGFYSLPGLETPDSEQRISGLYEKGKPFRPKHDYQVDPGRLAFGQERLAITPFQMAMVVAAVANNGVLMKPYVVEQIVTPGGKVLKETKPKEIGRVMKRSTAEDLTAMMTLVVSAGTGTAARIPGVEVAGKTGTAETGVAGRNTTWFVAFAPARKATVAVSVALENQTGTGGTTAAPPAREIMATALRESVAP